MERTGQRDKAGIIWLVQAASGLGLVILLLLHIIANHFVVQGGLQTYSDVVAYLSAPLILVLEILFLIVVTVHALLGVRAIVFDLGLTHRSEQMVNLGLTGLGFILVGYGFWLTFTIITAGVN